jgi:hypothetical protein
MAEAHHLLLTSGVAAVVVGFAAFQGGSKLPDLEATSLLVAP